MLRKGYCCCIVKKIMRLHLCRHTNCSVLLIEAFDNLIKEVDTQSKNRTDSGFECYRRDISLFKIDLRLQYCTFGLYTVKYQI